MTPPAPTSGFSFARIVFVVLVAALLGAAVWLGAGIMALRAEVAALETEADVAKATAALAQSQLKERTLLAEGMINELQRQLRDRGDLSQLKAVRLAPPEGGAARGTLIWNPRQRAGSFVGVQLPTPADGENYVLWITDSLSGARTNAGVVRVLADGKAVTNFQPAPGATFSDDFSVTVEANGSTSSGGGRVILSGK